MTQESSNHVPTPVSVERLVSLLNSEIQDIQSGNSRNGWSVWVILAAIVGALWLLLDVDALKSGTAQFRQVALVTLFGFALVDAVRWFYVFLNYGSGDVDEEGRFNKSSNLFAASRITILFEIIRSTLIIAAAVYSGAISGWTKAAVVAAYGYHELMAFSALAFSFFEYLIPVKKLKSSFGFLVALVLLFTTAASCLLRLLPIPVGDALASYRIGGLIIVVIYLLSLLGITVLESPTLDNLIKLRRKLIFGEISLDAAVQQSRIALGGMHISDAFRDNVIGILTALDAMNHETKNAWVCLDSIKSNKPDPQDDSELAVVKRDKFNSLDSTFGLILTERNRHLQRFTDEVNKYNKKLRWVARGTPAVDSTINSINQTVNETARDADSRFAKLTHEYQEVTESANSK